jgi:hypothetical protein
VWRLRSILLAFGMTAFGIVALTPTNAFGDEPEKGCNPRIRQCFVSTDRESSRATRSKASDNVRPASGKGPSRRKADLNERARETAQRFEQEYAAFVRARAARNMCRRLRGAERCGQIPLPDPYLLLGTANANGGPPVIQITPAQAGAIAVARLQLPTVAPGIGPSPDLNRWKMAAVGYPLWLWADGPAHVGPVSDSVAGLSVSLEARVTSLTFRMGDGNTVQCSGDGDEWTQAVEPGTKAPTCGYTYAQPSLPKDDYTVSAVTNWAVTWTANGQSGVINVPAVQTTELPVGELQVLVR